MSSLRCSASGFACFLLFIATKRTMYGNIRTEMLQPIFWVSLDKSAVPSSCLAGFAIPLRGNIHGVKYTLNETLAADSEVGTTGSETTHWFYTQPYHGDEICSCTGDLACIHEPLTTLDESDTVFLQDIPCREILLIGQDCTDGKKAKLQQV